MSASSTISRSVRERGREDPADHVLGKALGKHHPVTLLDEMSDSKGILVGVSTGKALVCHIEEGVMLLLLDHVTYLSPLLFRRIDASRIVRTSVQQDDRVLGSSLEILDHSIKVETNGVLVVVSVFRHLKTRILEDGVVVRPARRGNVDLLAARIETFKERAAYSKGTSTRDGLCDGDAIFFDWR